MTISPGDILRADIPGLRSAVQAWVVTTEGIDDAFDTLSQATAGLPDIWPSGSAAEAAQARVLALRSRLGRAYEIVGGVPVVLQRFTDDIEYYRNRLLDLVREAEFNGLAYDADRDELSGDPALVLVYRQHIDDITARVDDLDRQGGEFLPTGQWLLDDYAVQETPSAAHRTELAQERADLQARRADLTQAMVGIDMRARSGRPGPYDMLTTEDLRDTDARLRNVDALERRLADPSQHLIDYRPGDEQNAVVARDR